MALMILFLSFVHPMFLLDLAKGLAHQKGEQEAFISAAIERRLRDSGKANPVFVMTGPTQPPEVALAES